jgi:hypothetical protein
MLPAASLASRLVYSARGGSVPGSWVGWQEDLIVSGEYMLHKAWENAIPRSRGNAISRGGKDGLRYRHSRIWQPYRSFFEIRPGWWLRIDEGVACWLRWRVERILDGIASQEGAPYSIIAFSGTLFIYASRIGQQWNLLQIHFTHQRLRSNIGKVDKLRWPDEGARNSSCDTITSSPNGTKGTRLDLLIIHHILEEEGSQAQK